jgi:thioredoxin-related protein
MAVTTGINWISDIEAAKAAARSAKLPLLLFFHSVHCNGCRRTLAETVTDSKVIAAIAKAVVPGLFEISEQAGLANEYKIEWTPTFIIADESGKELYRWVGFLPAKEFLAQLELGLGRAVFTQGDFVEAEKHFAKLLSDYPSSIYAPEARYWQGVSEYKRTQNDDDLTRTWQDLQKQYPDNIWTEKASVWK